MSEEKKVEQDERVAFKEFRTALCRFGDANTPMSIADRVMILSNATFLLDEYVRASSAVSAEPSVEQDESGARVAAFKGWFKTAGIWNDAITQRAWLAACDWMQARAASTSANVAQGSIKPQASLVTFDEFVQYGKDHGANIVNGMPWSFSFNGHAVTHETDDLYFIGTPSIKFRRGELLLATAFGEHRLLQVLSAPTANVAQGAEAVEWNALTAEDRQAAFESLPDMLDGFLKKWGWLHFAKEIERRCREKNTAQSGGKS